jgi:hypothetical protein
MSKLLPRLIRFKNAPSYLGMDRNRFNKEVRPYVTEIPIGIQGIAFDRLELDAWVEQYKSLYGRPALRKNVCNERKYQDSLNEGSTGPLTKKSSELAFMKALELSRSKKQKHT